MKKFYLITFFTIWSSTILYAQTDSLKNEIINYKDSKVLLINKGRLLITDKFIEGNIDKATDVFEYLSNKVEDSAHFAFYPHEKQLIYYWTAKYDLILKDILNYDPLYSQIQYYPNYLPLFDSLYSILLSKSRVQREMIRAQIDSSGLTDKKKEFLKLNFDFQISQMDRGRYYTPYSCYDEINQDSLNQFADRYLSIYPNTEYENFIRKYIRYKFIASKWSYGFEAGYGYLALTKDLHRKFKDINCLGLGFHFSYNKFIFFLSTFMGSGDLRDSILYESTRWEKDAHMDINIMGASIGYNLYKNPRVKTIPFIGISSTSIHPGANDIKKNPQYKNIDLNTTTYSIGLNLEYQPFSGPRFHSGFSEEPEIFVRLGYCYYLPQFDKRYQGFSGNIHNVTLSIGLNYRKIKRMK